MAWKIERHSLGVVQQVHSDCPVKPVVRGRPFQQHGSGAKNLVSAADLESDLRKGHLPDFAMSAIRVPWFYRLAAVRGDQIEIASCERRIKFHGVVTSVEKENHVAVAGERDVRENLAAPEAEVGIPNVLLLSREADFALAFAVPPQRLQLEHQIDANNAGPLEPLVRHRPEGHVLDPRCAHREHRDNRQNSVKGHVAIGAWAGEPAPVSVLTGPLRTSVPTNSAVPVSNI